MQGIAELLSRRGRIIQIFSNNACRHCYLSPFWLQIFKTRSGFVPNSPEEYFRLINEDLEVHGRFIQKYYGRYGKHAGDGMVYHFLRSAIPIIS